MIKLRQFDSGRLPIFRCVVRGLPKGSTVKARAFYNPKTGKHQASVYAGKTDKDWRYWIRMEAQKQVPRYTEEAVELQLVFMLPRPKSVSKKKRPHPSVKPDLTSLVRSAEDALKGIVWKDDSQVCRQITSKIYDAGQVGVTITVRIMDAEYAPV